MKDESLEGIVWDEMWDLNIDGLFIWNRSNWDDDTIIIVVMEHSFSDGREFKYLGESSWCTMLC